VAVGVPLGSASRIMERGPGLRTLSWRGEGVVYGERGEWCMGKGGSGVWGRGEWCMGKGGEWCMGEGGSGVWGKGGVVYGGRGGGRGWLRLTR